MMLDITTVAVSLVNNASKENMNEIRYSIRNEEETNDESFTTREMRCGKMLPKDVLKMQN
jgi:hypothetical protein